MQTKEQIQTELNAERLRLDMAQSRIEELEKKLAHAPSSDEGLADILHELICHWNHTDGCGWFYEDWAALRPGSTRAGWLDKARKLRAYAEGQGISIDQMVEILTYAKKGLQF